MDFTDYLELIAKKLRISNREEYLRVLFVLKDAVNNTIKKLEEPSNVPPENTSL